MTAPDANKPDRKPNVLIRSCRRLSSLRPVARTRRQLQFTDPTLSPTTIRRDS
jgi:hypothetical protein